MREMISIRLSESDLIRFDNFVFPCPMSGCEIWAGASNPNGYGLFRLGNQGDQLPYSKKYPLMLATRVSCLIHGVNLFKGDCVLHKCDTPSCVRIDHLFIGTQQDNVADCVLKRRGKFHRTLPFGVVPAPNGKFYGKVVFKNKQIHCGTHDTAAEAHRAAVEKKSFLYGERFDLEV